MESGFTSLGEMGGNLALQCVEEWIPVLGKQEAENLNQGASHHLKG